MKSSLGRIVVLVVVACITSGAVLANTTRKEVTFAEAVTVNSALVKQGTYEVKFDDETNKLTIVKGRKVIASAEAKLEKVEGTKQGQYVTRAETNDAKAPVLLSISLKSGHQITVVNSGG